MTPFFVDIKGSRYTVEQLPSECPICHYSIQPGEVDHRVLPSRGFRSDTVEVVYQCPRPDCGHLFIGSYTVIAWGRQHGMYSTELHLSSVAPRTPRPPDIPEEVASVSPDFVDIYSQALAAEDYGLFQVAGVGLRKALEFLIKDYCLHTHDDDAETIKSTNLSSCIKRYVDNPNIRQCAERAAWLGNDETHYVRKWEDKDITDLKTLITLTVNWIHSDVLTKKYVDDMPS